MPRNIVLGNRLQFSTTANLSYNDSAGGIEYKTVGNQNGSLFVGIEPFINGNLSISLKVDSDSWLSQTYIIGSTFMIETNTRADGKVRVSSMFQTSDTQRSSKHYDVPVAALENGVNTIHIAINGTTKSLRIYHNDSVGIKTPMYHWTVQELPYQPMTMPMLMIQNDKSSHATWMSTTLFGLKETVNGGIVSSIPGNDFVPFGIDFPTDFANGKGTQYMATMNQTGVAWIDLGWLEKHPEQIQHTQSLLDSGWELGIHFSTPLTNFSMEDAKSFMVEQYNQATEIFGQSPITWCSLTYGDNISHAVFAYEEFGMIWRNGYSWNGYITNVGTLEETRWPEFWSKVSEAQMVFPSFTHWTDQSTAQAFSMTYMNFTKWVDNYKGKHIIGFHEYYFRVRNQVDTNINYLDYVEGKTLKFSVECNQYQSRLVINFPLVDNATVLKNGAQLVKNVDYSVIDSDHIALFSASNDTFEISS